MPRSVSNSEFKKMVFKPIPMDPVWIETFGELEEGFSMTIWGETGQGKTTLLLEFLKHLSEVYGKIYFNSHEQGMIGSLRKQAARLGILDLPSSRWVWGNRDSLSEARKKIKTNGCRVAVFDSRDSMKMTTDEFLSMIAENDKRKNKKNLIVVTWANGAHPKGEYGTGIAYMSDVKVRVHDKTTEVRSRFGPTKPYHIFGKPKTPNGQTLPIGI